MSARTASVFMSIWDTDLSENSEIAVISSDAGIM